MKGNKLTTYILIAMFLGVVIGYGVHEHTSPIFISSFLSKIKLLGTIFIRLIQMIISPLVFSTLVVRIALILPIDHFCDMFRTATNVLGNTLATSVVSKWEGVLENKSSI